MTKEQLTTLYALLEQFQTIVQEDFERCTPAFDKHEEPWECSAAIEINRVLSDVNFHINN